MGKSKKSLSAKKNISKRYRVVCDIEKFNQLQPTIKEISNLRKIGDTVVFETSSQPNDPELTVRDRYSSLWRKHIKPNIISLICLAIIGIVIMTTQKYITQITYTHDKDEAVYQMLKDSLVKRGPFLVVEGDLEVISQELRSKFTYYAWIGVDKRGSVLELTIISQDTPIVEPEDLTQTGHLVASSKGVITRMMVERGVVTVTLNQSVTEGQLLVSGNSNYAKEPNSNENLVKAKGLIIAKTVELQKFSINETTSDLVVTGEYQKKLLTSLQKWESPYEQFHEKKRILFHIGNLVIYNQYYYKKELVQSVHDEKSAAQYAQSMIYRNYLANKVSDYEVIHEILIVSVIKNDGMYDVLALVRSEKNIARFKLDLGQTG